MIADVPGWTRVIAAIVVATIAWWSSLSLVVDAWRPPQDELADALQTALTRRWDAAQLDPSAIERARNPEWDFISRTFLVLALANDALARPDAAAADLQVIDRVIEQTLVEEREHGQRWFLLPYVDRAPFVDASGRSVFVDGEIALMLAARNVVALDEGQALELRARVETIEAQMKRGPVLSAESYPDEAWVFCNSTALVALKAADAVLGTKRDELIEDWLEVARERLVDPESGLLVSSFTHDGRVLDGPEGSTLWMTTHNLLLLDPDLARAQYDAGKAALVSGFFGFAWAREWPSESAFADRQSLDVDSGGVVPLLGASAGSSGMLLLAAAAFEDEELLDGLMRSLELGAFPIQRGGGTELAAAGVIGSTVALYALRFGPLWDRIEETAA